MVIIDDAAGPAVAQRFQYFCLRRLNPVMKWLLQSRFHHVVSNNILLITFAGRRSGRLFTTPVSYIREGDIITLATPRACRWWVNLLGGATVTLLVGRREFAGEARVIVEDEAQKIARIRRLLDLVPRDAPYYPVRLDAEGIPDAADLERAARSHVVITVHVPALSQQQLERQTPCSQSLPEHRRQR
jgi:deazaflavin-dependent oxidoreductase (nitroreductase family)